MQKLGALWSRRDKNDNEYFNGSLDVNNTNVPVVIFKNLYKGKPNQAGQVSPNQPDYIIYLSEKKKEEKKDSQIPF